MSDNVDSTKGKDDAVQTTFGIGNTSDVSPQILKKCKLYLPAAVPFRDTASYENVDLGAVLLQKQVVMRHKV